jgi:hypothetical protein
MLFLADPPEILHSNAKQAQIAEASFQDYSHSHNNFSFAQGRECACNGFILSNHL